MHKFFVKNLVQVYLTMSAYASTILVRFYSTHYVVYKFHRLHYCTVW